MPRVRTGGGMLRTRCVRCGVAHHELSKPLCGVCRMNDRVHHITGLQKVLIVCTILVTLFMVWFTIWR